MFYVHLLKLARYTMFTVWCWALQCAFFGLSAYISLVGTKNLFLLNTCVILYECSFAAAFLVTTVVTFILIPGQLRRGVPVENFFKFLPQAMHNLNVLFMALEMVLNKTPFVVRHFPFAAFLGISYIVFAWYWFKVKGVFYYFFIDYQDKYAVRWYISLLGILSMFFLAGSGFSSLLDSGANYARVGFLVFTFLIMKVYQKPSEVLVLEKEKKTCSACDCLSPTHTD